MAKTSSSYPPFRTKRPSRNTRRAGNLPSPIFVSSLSPNSLLPELPTPSAFEAQVPLDIANGAATVKELPWPGGPPNLMKTKISVPPAQNRARQQADAFGAGTVMASSGERTQILGGTTMRDRIDQNFRNETFELNPR